MARPLEPSPPTVPVDWYLSWSRSSWPVGWLKSTGKWRLMRASHCTGRQAHPRIGRVSPVVVGFPFRSSSRDSNIAESAPSGPVISQIATSGLIDCFGREQLDQRHQAGRAVQGANWSRAHWHMSSSEQRLNNLIKDTQ